MKALSMMFVFFITGLAQQAFAAEAVCVAKARADRTKSRAVRDINGKRNVKKMLRRTCKEALLKCHSKARRPGKCEVIRAVVKFPGLEGFRIPAEGPDGGDWIRCADEHQTCELPRRGTYTVRYGKRGKFVYRDGVSGSIRCTNRAFGRDPIRGTFKACWYKGDSSLPGRRRGRN